LLLFVPITDLAVSVADFNFVDVFADNDSFDVAVVGEVDSVGDSTEIRCWPSANSSSMIQSTSRNEFSLLRSVNRSIEKSRKPLALIFIVFV
jgi:hypothetical protein